jgi:uncharacterized protein (DUF427 family)
VTLTVGNGPFGHRPAGSFNFKVPDDGVEYIEESPRWIRGFVNGELAIDSRGVKLLHASRSLPVWCFPPEDVKTELLPEGAAWVYEESLARGLVGVRFDAVDRWLEEDEEAIVHPRDPYHRIDVRASSRRVVVALDRITLADSTRALALFESSLPTRWYLPPEDVQAELVPREGFQTGCAYKGYAAYWDVRVGDRLEPALAWHYDDPVEDVARIAGRVCFFNERVDLDLDGEREPRPESRWSGTDWLSDGRS